MSDFNGFDGFEKCTTFSFSHSVFVAPVEPPPLSIAIEALDLGSQPKWHGEMRNAGKMATEYAECEAWPSAISSF